jgi:hypothetical protein
MKLYFNVIVSWIGYNKTVYIIVFKPGLVQDLGSRF